MPVQYWESLLNAGAPWQTTAGTVLNTAATATISPQSAGPNDFTLPANYFYPGCVIKVTALGYLSSGGTASNLTVWLAGGVSGTLGTILASTPAVALGTGTIVGVPWRLEALIQCTAIGSSGNTLLTNGSMWFPNVTAPAFATANGVAIGLPGGAVAGTAVALSTITAQSIGLRASLSAAFGAILCSQFLLEALD